MSHYKSFLLLPAAALAFAVGSAAYAGEDGKNDALYINQAKVSLVEAVTAAEHHVKGKASRAEYEKSEKGEVYEVEVVKGKEVFDVKVDALKGTVLSVVKDPSDGEDRNEKGEE